jgi:hypothetical protein
MRQVYGVAEVGGLLILAGCVGLTIIVGSAVSAIVARLDGQKKNAATFEQAKEVARILEASFCQHKWFSGVAVIHDGHGYAVSFRASDRYTGDVPTEVNGVRVEIVQRRRANPLATPWLHW